MSITLATKKRVFRLFAAGHTPEGVVKEFEKARGPGKKPKKPTMTLTRAETLYEEYLALTIGEKLRLTLMPENVSDRLHRLTDDISDLSLVDGLLSESDKKTLALLLDIKRKIKERMSKEFNADGEAASNARDGESDSRFNKFYDEMREGEGPGGTPSE